MTHQSAIGAMLALALGIAPVTDTSAALIDLGTETLDTATDLRWLDLSLTDGMSPLAALTAFSGYRWATDDEVYTLFLDGGMTAVDAVGRSADYLDAQNLTNLLGLTFSASASRFGLQGWALFPDWPTLFIEPFLEVRSDIFQGRAYPGGALGSATTVINDVGVFLVRSVPVPEPNSLALIGSVLFGLGLRFRSSRHVRSGQPVDTVIRVKRVDAAWDRTAART